MWAARHAAITSVIGLAVIGAVAARCGDRDAAPPPVAPTSASPAHGCASPPDDSALEGMTAEERALATAWRAVHACEALPVCAHPDPVATLVADVDDAPGAERVIGTNRFGVLMYAAGGRVLGRWHETRCGSWPDGGQELHLEARPYAGADRHPMLVVRDNVLGHCGEFPTTYLVARGPDDLDTLAMIDEEGRRGCNVWSSEIRMQIAPSAPGVIVVRYDGTHTDGDGTHPVHAACAVRLDGVTSPEVDVGRCR